ncbi:unnamed protein product [Pleuronectes platessa]|uniref:Uncharacterized protein n=1 Tax=Pleuronectes platessa TaxID=8262 RepID=A0A9N7TZP7_PLEPL|nr:unnamed protein product [Pleuronectes platessa]
MELAQLKAALMVQSRLSTAREELASEVQTGDTGRTVQRSATTRPNCIFPDRNVVLSIMSSVVWSAVDIIEAHLAVPSAPFISCGLLSCNGTELAEAYRNSQGIPVRRRVRTFSDRCAVVSWGRRITLAAVYLHGETLMYTAAGIPTDKVMFGDLSLKDQPLTGRERVALVLRQGRSTDGQIGRAQDQTGDRQTSRQDTGRTDRQDS